MNPISGIPPVSPVGQPPVGHTAPAGKSGSGEGIGKLFESYVQTTNNTQVASSNAIDDFVAGKTDNVQQVIMAVANAELSFQLFMEIRNKLIDSYNELTRMQF